MLYVSVCKKKEKMKPWGVSFTHDADAVHFTQPQFTEVPSSLKNSE